MTDGELDQVGRQSGVFVVKRMHITIATLILALIGGVVKLSDRVSASSTVDAQFKSQVDKNTTDIRSIKTRGDADHDLLVEMSATLKRIEVSVAGLEERERSRQ